MSYGNYEKFELLDITNLVKQTIFVALQNLRIIKAIFICFVL